MKAAALYLLALTSLPLAAEDKKPAETPKVEIKRAEAAEAPKAEKPSKPAAEVTQGKKAAVLKLVAMTVSGGLANVTVSDETTRRVIPLPFEKDADGNQLVSATLDAEKGEMKVVAMIRGERHTLAQAVKQRPATNRGPSEEDRKKYESLSEAGKEKFRDGMREMFKDEHFRNLSEEDRRSAVRSLFDKIDKEDAAR